MTTTPKHPDLEVKLIGQDGNIFNLLGVTSGALNRAGYADDAKKMVDEVFECDSYDQALCVLMKYVVVT